ncbi:MAG: mechanosensitive ion channel [Methanosarcinales archaeon]|nr:mechanosensitive ion channel [Methanosarcinales archaeon]
MQDITLYLTDVFRAVEPYLKVILVIVVAFFVISLIKRIVRRLLDVTSLPLDVQNILRRIVVYVLWLTVLMYVSIALRLEEIFMPLIGASVLVGAAVALAVKDALSDAVAGIFLLLDRHFNIGDEIETMNRRGEIIDVTLRKTRLKTGDGTIVVLPNGKIDSSGWILHNEKTEAEKK